MCIPALSVLWELRLKEGPACTCLPTLVLGHSADLNPVYLCQNTLRHSRKVKGGFDLRKVLWSWADPACWARYMYYWGLSEDPPHLGQVVSPSFQMSPATATPQELGCGISGCPRAAEAGRDRAAEASEAWVTDAQSRTKWERWHVAACRFSLVIL